MEITTIFHFKNGYAFYGLIKGSQIVDGKKGVIMKNETNENIEVLYQYVSSIQSGSFKSIDGKKLFLFKYSDRNLAVIDLNQSQEEKTKKDND